MMQSQRSGVYRMALACMVLAGLAISRSQVHAQGRDALVNGALVGAAIGAGAGVAFTHAVRDSDLVFSQYARGAVIFGAIGAGAGLGLDALFARRFPAADARRLSIAPLVWRDLASVAVKWRW